MVIWIFMSHGFFSLYFSKNDRGLLLVLKNTNLWTFDCIKCLSIIVLVSQPSVEVHSLCFIIFFLGLCTNSQLVAINLHIYDKTTCTSKFIWWQFQPYKAANYIYEGLHVPPLIFNNLPTSFNVLLSLFWTSINSWPITWFTPLLVHCHAHVLMSWRKLRWCTFRKFSIWYTYNILILLMHFNQYKP